MASGVLDYTRLKRDPDKIRKCLKKVGDTTVATEDLSIVFPVRFVNKGLCKLDITTELIAYYAILDTKGNYGVTTSPAMQHLKPSNITTTSITRTTGGTEQYIVLKFYKGNVVYTTSSMVKEGSIIFNIVNELFMNGNIPWYFNYEDISSLLLDSKLYTGSDVGSNPVGLEVLTSLVCKSPKNFILPYKDGLKTRDDILKDYPYIQGLNDVLSYDDTGAKLIGSYMDQGLTSALVEKESKSADASDLLRS